MNILFQKLKQLKQTYSGISVCEEELSAVQEQLSETLKQNREYKTQLEKILHIEKYNGSSKKIIYSKGIDGDFWTIGVKTKYNSRGQMQHLEFELCNLSDTRTPLYWYGFLGIDVFYDTDQMLKSFKIWDFKVKEENKGQGSMLLGEVLLYLSQIFGEKIEINGWLSTEDEGGAEKRQRIDHVYQKFGFHIEGSHIFLNELPIELINKERKKWNDKK
ncbi:hypothetical protein [Lactococcus garvieae]|uniref:hypothetical protein n=1 Tax=Lactococcus garvieae TaxID=1363 RepID=UPI0009BDF6D5|nr:hypothetical protein [Lactococcus garvieae]